MSLSLKNALLDVAISLQALAASIPGPGQPEPVEDAPPPLFDPEPPIEPVPMDEPLPEPVEPITEPAPEVPPVVDPVPEPVSEPPAELQWPGNIATTYAVKPYHPRLFWRDDTAARIALVPGIVDRMKTAAIASGANGLNPARMLCGAALVRLGMTEYLGGAVIDLMTCTMKEGDTHADTWKLTPTAIAYDWLFDWLTEAQRDAVRTQIANHLTSKPAYLNQGYNYDGGLGMIPALAIYGETEADPPQTSDWVAYYWGEWWNGFSKFHNREFERNWQRGGGTREGWTYFFGDQSLMAILRGAWESATGDTESLRYFWMEAAPYLALHQADPTDLLTKKLFRLPCFGYGAAYNDGKGYPPWMGCMTGSKDKQTAQLAAWMLAQNSIAWKDAAQEFICRVLIGDPSVQPKSPFELNLPLEFTTEQTGYHWDRTSWTSDAMVVFFGCQHNATRTFPQGDVMVMDRGKVLLGSRDGIYRHHYGPDWTHNRIVIEGVATYSGSSAPDRVARGRLGTSVLGWHIADTTLFYKGTTVKQCSRKFRFLHDTKTIEVFDEIRLAPGATNPVRMTWNTPDLPTVDGNVIRLQNGGVRATMTFDVAPLEIKVVGGYPTGKTNATEALADPSFPFGRDYYGKISNTDMTDKFQDWLPIPRDEQIREGGFFAVWVTPPVVGGAVRMQTTVQVAE